MPRTDEEKEERRIRDKKNREYLKAIHRCRDCKKIDAYTLMGRTRCADCVAKETERKRISRNKDKEAEKQKKIREKRKEEHRCVYCGTKLNEEYRYATCNKCRNKQTEYQRTYKAKKFNSNFPRGANSICFQCNKKPVIEGKKLCQECYEKKIEIVNKMNEINKKEKEFVFMMAKLWWENGNTVGD